MMRVKTSKSYTKIIIISVVAGIALFLILAAIGVTVYFAFFYQYPQSTTSTTAATTVKVYLGNFSD